MILIQFMGPNNWVFWKLGRLGLFSFKKVKTQFLCQAQTEDLPKVSTCEDCQDWRFPKITKYEDWVWRMQLRPLMWTSVVRLPSWMWLRSDWGDCDHQSVARTEQLKLSPFEKEADKSKVEKVNIMVRCNSKLLQGNLESKTGLIAFWEFFANFFSKLIFSCFRNISCYVVEFSRL